MNTGTIPSAGSVRKTAFATAMLVVLGAAASAQLGSLVVSITSPANGASVSATIPVSAQVTAVGGLITAGVQFKVDGVNLGAEDTSSPYSVSWNTTAVANGSHSLTAVARDVLGGQWTSNPLTVTVFNDLTAPTVSITSPSAGASVRGAVSIAATASDNVGVAGVQFRLDGANLGAEDTSAPYAISWDTIAAANGSHALTAIARDAAGNTTTVAAVTVSVDNGAPAAGITSPAGGALVRGSVTITADAFDNVAVAGVQFAVDGAALGAEDTSAPFTAAWDTSTGSNDSHSLTATARDAAGNTTTTAAVIVTVDNAAPSVSISAPTGGSTVSSSMTVMAAASDNVAVAGVQFLLDGSALGAEDTNSPYGVSWDTTTASNGTHLLSAAARDGAGNVTTSATVSITVSNDAVAPSVAISSPAGGATVSGAVTVSAAASDDVAVIGVQFRLDGAPLGPEDTSAPYEAAWDTTAGGDGSHTLTAVARDGADNTAVSSAITVTVANQAGTTTTRVEDSSSQIFYTPAGSWMLGYTDARGWSGGTAALGFGVGHATLSFTGTGVSWIGFRGPQTGIARVHLDNVLVATVDAYSPTEMVQAVLYTASGLPNAAHTITIEVTHTRNDASSDYYVIVDAFDITTPGGAPADTTPPSVTLTSPTEGATLSGTVTLAATAADNVGVSTVQFYVDGSPFGSADTTAPYEISWNTTAATNGSHNLMVQARDAAGNTSLSAIVHVTVANADPPPPPPGSNIRIEDGNTAITYHGSWNVGNAARPWSGGTAAIGFGIGQDAIVTFRGTGITWIGFRGPWAGIANVYVDGAFAAMIDGYAAAESVQAPMFTASGLGGGPHTLTIEVTRTRNAASTDYVVIVDALDIIDAPPDTVAPSVSISTPVNNTTVFATVPFKADADDDSGVAAVTFFVDGAQVGTADSISPYAINWNTTTIADGAHTLTAVARDAAGNTTASAPVTVVVANAAPPALATATRIENTNLGIIYVDGCPTCGQVPTWFHGSRSRTWSDGTASFNRSDGARATYPFTGTAVKWIGFRAAWAGIAKVFIDGAFVAEVDLFSPTEEVQVPVFQVSDLASGSHTIAIESTGRKNPEATDYAVVLDAFDVSPGAPPPVAGTRYEESAPSATFTAGWNLTDTTHAWSGGTAATASSAGERATFTFTGTAVKWVGKRGPGMGIARVYLDGAFQAQVDAYFPSTIQGLVYSATALLPGEHRLEIEVTGTSNNQATGQAIAVDAFDVRSRIEDSDAPVVYSGAWTLNDVARNWSETSLTTGTGTASFASTAGARADLTFTGTAVTWVGLRAPVLGIADVYLDGTFAQQIDLYSATEQVQAALFTASGLASGTHTLRIEATGTKNPAASTARVYVDTFDVTLPSPATRVTRVPDTDAAITYSAGWTAAGASSLWSGTNAKEHKTVGAQASFTFSGTMVRWLGERGFATGVARVSIDGQFVGVVDTRTPFQEEYQEPVFMATGLAPGTHTLTIEIVGRNNEAPGSTVDRVVIDAFEIDQP